MLNKVELSGKMFYDAQVQKFASGNELVKGTMVQNRSFTNRDGATQEVGSWFDLEFVGEAANKARNLKKGQSVEIFGALEQQRWEDKTTQAKRSKIIVKVLSFKEVDSRPSPANLNTKKPVAVGNSNTGAKGNVPVSNEEIEDIPF